MAGMSDMLWCSNMGRNFTDKIVEKALVNMVWITDSCISMSKKYHVYSKVSDGDWNKVTFDFTSIEGSNEPDLTKLLSKPEKTKLPDVLLSRSKWEVLM